MGVSLRRWVRPEVIATVSAVSALASIALANGSVVDISVACSQLSASQREELDARARLLTLGAANVDVRRVQFLCDDEPAVVVLRTPNGTTKASIEPGPQPVEQALAALDLLLARSAREASSVEPSKPTTVTAPDDRPKASDRDSPPDDVTPPQELPQAPETPQNVARTIGGAGLGVAVEPWPAPASTGVGPRLDLAWGYGSWSAVSFESLRLGSTPQHSLVVFDALVGAAWGGPFGPNTFGAALAIGGEWFSANASDEPTSKRSRSTFVVDFGLRFAQPLGAGTLWFAADGLFRAHELDLPDPITASLSRWSVVFSAGGALTVR